MATSLFQSVIDCWGACLDACVILSCNVVSRIDSVVLIELLKKFFKKVKGIITDFMLD